VPPAYPSDFVKEVERRWRRRAAATLPTPRNDNAAGGSLCPTCNALGPVVPSLSEHRAPGLIYQHWRCAACGHAWITTQTVNT